MLDGLKEPTVFQGMVDSWPASKWNPEELKKIFKDKRLKFRIGRKNFSDVQWETECFHQSATMQDFMQWLEGNTDASNPLDAFPIDDHWCYMDYKYMAQIFADQPEILKSVDWSAFGFKGRGGKESTMWLGSRGASTVCHVDTYGCNLVAQIHGRKRWVLFPPSDTCYLYPTRIPYEESSIFSRVNVTAPDIMEHPLFKGSHPTVVELKPGEVLYVPRHWWHYVESVDPVTISINSWIEMESDKVERISEAVTRTLCFLMMPSGDAQTNTWMNPTEEETDLATNLEYIRMSLNASSEKGANATPEGDRKRTNSAKVNEPCLKKVKLMDDEVIEKNVKQNVPRMEFTDYIKCDFVSNVSSQFKNLLDSKQDVSLEDFVRCVTHPETVAVIVDKLKQQAHQHAS
ncbi:hypothetical protein CAPTEDRAFT_166923 [Capitella teleta]|uniref:JmjC domain-containing protein n=1 Tax=Capitella teleta TaxID=283909 RepID=R7UIJ2_CAPTE|nr:hypothetical protein CAPTEDRAFT_166923 [Capitella teleta]|eukprot:ELU03608.1 hypothetical protein CAPTEDRAFT_166923 [Capitella teleta]